MERVLKFRAWVKDEYSQPHMSKPFDFTDFDMDYFIPEGCCIEHLDIMQFTCLVDKHGKEVYEGDIIKAYKYEYWHDKNPQELIRLVEYDEFMVLQPFHAVADYDGNFWIDCLLPEGFAVIGNVYENPELLEVPHVL